MFYTLRFFLRTLLLFFSRLYSLRYRAARSGYPLNENIAICRSFRETWSKVTMAHVQNYNTLISSESNQLCKLKSFLFCPLHNGHVKSCFGKNLLSAFTAGKKSINIFTAKPYYAPSITKFTLSGIAWSGNNISSMWQ